MDCINIYFSGSIKGGRQLAQRYNSMIKELSCYGKVLTEHIGNINYGVGGYTDASTIYQQDKQFLDESHIVIADITVPSLGVGYELAYAEAKGIPTFCLYESGATVSSMIVGNDYFQCCEYDDTQHAQQLIKNIMTKYSNEG